MKTRLVVTCLLLCACNETLDAAPARTHTTSGLHHPESALWDPASGTWFVSNIGEFDTSGDGFITRLDAEGEMLEARFVIGLDDPKGMAILDGVLYVADLRGVVSIPLQAPEAASLMVLPGSVFLNDLAADAWHGIIYASDSFGNAIYQLEDGHAIELIRDEALETPNGLAVTEGQLYIASVGPDVDPQTFLPSQPGRILRLELSTGELTEETERLGGLDGLVVYGDEFLVSDTLVGVYHVDAERNFELYIDTAAHELAGSADIGFDPLARRLAVPQLFGNAVTFFEFR